MSQEETDLNRSVGYLLKMVQSALRSRMDAVLGPLELSAPQYACLELLNRSPALSNSELARGAFVSRQSMNTVLHTLRQRGLVEQVPGPVQGKAQPMRLTGAGRELLSKAGTAVRSIEEQMVSGLTPEQHDTVVEALSSCAAKLEG